jgi:hypothetical protein
MASSVLVAVAVHSSAQAAGQAWTTGDATASLSQANECRDGVMSGEVSIPLA